MPVPIQSITFKKLTFGEAPVRVESIWVNNEDQDDHLDMEMVLRWCGDANITLDIQVFTPAGKVSVCPQGFAASSGVLELRVSDISFAARLKCQLAPLIDKPPGFGAIMLTFPRPPRIKYHLNFGALGGSYAAGESNVCWNGHCAARAELSHAVDSSTALMHDDVSFCNGCMIMNFVHEQHTRIPASRSYNDGQFLKILMDCCRLSSEMTLRSATDAGAGVVKPVIKSIINNALLENMVWPARILQPIPLAGPPDPNIEKRINKMRHIHVGLLKVRLWWKPCIQRVVLHASCVPVMRMHDIEVVRAEGLSAADLSGKSDPMVELTTDSKYVSCSRAQRQTLNPVWNESFWHLVQTPKSQEVRLTVLDWDFLSASDVIGRAVIKVRPATEMESDSNDETGVLRLCEYDRTRAMRRGLHMPVIIRLTAQAVLCPCGTDFAPFACRCIHGARAGKRFRAHLPEHDVSDTPEVAAQPARRHSTELPWHHCCPCCQVYWSGQDKTPNACAGVLM
eukprot:365725-Chlamydomonas_euryale.AAC.38